MNKPGWWDDGECRTTNPRSSFTDKKVTPTLNKEIKDENLSVVVNRLLDDIKNQSIKIEDLEYQNKILSKNYFSLSQKLVESERINEELRQIVRNLGYHHEEPKKSDSEIKVLPYLYISENAPKKLFDAVYRAAVKLHHPDTGGEEEVIKVINSLKDEIYKKKGW